MTFPRFARWGFLAAGFALAIGMSTTPAPVSADVRIGINIGPPGYYVPYYHPPYYGPYYYRPPTYYPYPYGPYYRAYPYAPYYRYYRNPYYVPYYEQHRRYYH
jgi:hypothetical protein